MQAQQEVPYDPFNPYPWYRYMRETCPVYYNEQVKMWYVFRYDDVQQILTDIKTFSSAGIQGDTYLEASFLRMDPPRHRRYRTLVSQAFTPRSVALLEPRISAIVNDLLDAVARTGQMDVITDLAYPLPATVIMEVFGVPVADRETTTNLIGNAMFCFTKYPAVMAELLARPELLPDALEEVLRYRPAVCGTFRITTADAQIGTATIKARQPLIVQISSANHDETVFADPEHFDIRRAPNRHLGFGQGAHFCLGAPLARLESKIAFSVLLQRFPDLQRSSDTPVQLEMGPAGLFQGTKHFPVTLTA